MWVGAAGAYRDVKDGDRRFLEPLQVVGAEAVRIAEPVRGAHLRRAEHVDDEGARDEIDRAPGICRGFTRTQLIAPALDHRRAHERASRHRQELTSRHEGSSACRKAVPGERSLPRIAGNGTARRHRVLHLGWQPVSLPVDGCPQRRLRSRPMRQIDIDTIREAARSIYAAAIRTPLVRLDLPGGPNETEIYLKLETLQPIGSFKIRGAYNAVRQLSARAARATGVWTVSAGNAAQGVALAARQSGAACSSW